MFYCSGSDWYGTENKFGYNTSYCKADERFEFTSDNEYVYGHTVTLYPVSNGNLETKEIEESWTEEDIEFFHKLSFEERVFYADYLSTEFEITKFLMDFAKINKAVLAGLEYRVKSPKSLYNKLYQRVEKSFFDSIADVIRYTVILEPKEYVEQIRSVTDALYEKNWKIYSLKNYWVNDSFPYNGVNAKFKNSRNYRIESQFHTQESFDVKMSEEDHKLYEQRRVLEPGCDEYNRILQLQLKLYSDMEYPENIADLEKI